MSHEPTRIPYGWEVPTVFRARVGDVAGRQRVIEADGHLLLILHELPSADSSHRKLRLFWRDAAGAWKSNALGAGIQALRKHLEEFGDRVHQLEDAEQNARGADDYFRIQREIVRIRRAAHNKHEALEMAHEFVPDDAELASCMNLAGTIERAADFVQDDAQRGLDYAMAKHAEIQSNSAHRLNLLAALFFPIATVAAIFGMNLNHGLETLDPWLFWVLPILGVGVGFYVKELVAPGMRMMRSGRTPHGSRQ